MINSGRGSVYRRGDHVANELDTACMVEENLVERGVAGLTSKVAGRL